jgi:hypothetical protein
LTNDRFWPKAIIQQFRKSGLTALPVARRADATLSADRRGPSGLSWESIEPGAQLCQTAFVHLVQMSCAHHPVVDQASLFQHPQMLGNRGSRYGDMTGDLTHGRRPAVQALKDETPGHISKCN